MNDLKNICRTKLNITFFCDWKRQCESQSDQICSLLSSYYTFINSITELFETLLPYCFYPAHRMKCFTSTLPFKPKPFLHYSQCGISSCRKWHSLPIHCTGRRGTAENLFAEKKFLSQPMYEDDTFNANLDAHFCNSQWVYGLQFTHSNNIYRSTMATCQDHDSCYQLQSSIRSNSIRLTSHFIHSQHFLVFLVFGNIQVQVSHHSFYCHRKKVIKLKVTCYYFQKF